MAHGCISLFSQHQFSIRIYLFHHSHQLYKDTCTVACMLESHHDNLGEEKVLIASTSVNCWEPLTILWTLGMVPEMEACQEIVNSYVTIHKAVFQGWKKIPFDMELPPRFCFKQPVLWILKFILRPSIWDLTNISSLQRQRNVGGFSFWISFLQNIHENEKLFLLQCLPGISLFWIVNVVLVTS